jgi:hypothetical protein
VVALAAVGGVLLATGVVGGGGGSGNDSLTGGPGDDKLSGTEGDDVLSGLGGADVVEAKGGDDTIDGGDGADFLYGGAGDDRFVESEDDALDVHDCGPGDDVVAEPDTRDQLLPSCERGAWTALPLSEKPYENTMTVKPRISSAAVEFTGTCAEPGCEGTIELRTPNDRKALGRGRFALAAGKAGPVRVTLDRRGLVQRGGYIRVVLRARPACGGCPHPQPTVNSGFTTYFAQ